MDNEKKTVAPLTANGSNNAVNERNDMDESRKYIRFDWAIKRMLRDKANFDVLEGLINVLTGEKAKIVEILESEGNQQSPSDKYNRVDIKALNDRDEIIIVEVQLNEEADFLPRILYGVSKAITEHIYLGQKYNRVKRIYSINIIYFNLGEGADYLYHGKTQFVGVHTNDLLQMSPKELNALGVHNSLNIFPEYYLICVNEFNKVARTPLEEWISYLKDGRINDDTTAPGLAEAKEKLQYMKMSDEERWAYEHEIMNKVVLQSQIDDAREGGLAEGLAEGRAKGLAEGRAKGLAEGRAKGLRKDLRKDGQKDLRKDELKDVKKVVKKDVKKDVKKVVKKRND